MTDNVTARAPSPPPHPTQAQQLAIEVEREFRQIDAGAFCVLARVVRRVVHNQLEFARPWLPPPHRKCCVIERDRLLWLVARDELGIDSSTPLPNRVILLARPDESELQRMSGDELRRYYWRLLFHARIDLELETSIASERLSNADLRKRIAELGQTQFDEIHAVLQAEQMLRKPDDLRQVYAEFVAVYRELEAFAPERLPLYFPSLTDPDAVDRVIGGDCHATALLAATRPGDLSAVVPPPAEPERSTMRESLLDAGPVKLTSRSPRKYAALVSAADRLRAKGNNVRAALVRRRAFEKAPLDQLLEAQQAMLREIELLVSRLQAALEMTPEQAQPWTAMCERLLPEARRGFWNANARLLFDLQQVCFDHEQELYKVDLLGWAFSGGAKPIKRPLKHQRVVLMSKHLRRAAKRVSSVAIDSQGRRELSELLHAAADAAEQILRRQFKPLVADALAAARFSPTCVVERVGFRKLTDELLDGVVERGFVTLGHLRDAISRNQLKSPDLKDAKEFFAGDPLLSADRILASQLEGVYQRGPFYMRWMQRASALAFGIPWGRGVTKYLILPVGLAFLALMTAEEVAVQVYMPIAKRFVAISQQSLTEVNESKATVPGAPPEKGEISRQKESAPAVKEAEPGSSESTKTPEPIESNDASGENLLANIEPMAEETAAQGDAPSDIPWEGKKKTEHLVFNEIRLAWLSCVMFALLHFGPFRRGVLTVLKLVRRILHLLLWEAPRIIATWGPVAWFLQSFPMLLIKRFILGPALVTTITYFLFPLLGFYAPLGRWWGVAIFIGSAAVLNSRMGRDTQELTREFVVRLVNRIRAHLIVGLFTFIIDTLRWLMDGFERLLYAVDEWLRFRSGESEFVLGVKAVFGLVWAFVHGVIRFCVTLLIEPQFNPIKHFPVVTVSHKVVLGTFAVPLARVIQSIYHYEPAAAYSTALLILSGIPGVFGFLAWEFKENWKLYAANRSRKLQPVQIGDHGESMRRLLVPGFHSGTIPRLFAKRRRAVRATPRVRLFDRQAWYVDRMHHEAESLRHFAERELLALLKETRTFRALSLEIGKIEMATNRIRIEIQNAAETSAPVFVEFDEQSGWIAASIVETGWLKHKSAEELIVFRAALAGFYKLAAVGLVREQIEARLVAAKLPAADSRHPSSSETVDTTVPQIHPYDVTGEGLVIWPYGHFESSVRYPLDDRPQSFPKPRALARAAGLGPIQLDLLVYDEHPILWDEWRQFWEVEQQGPTDATPLLPRVPLICLE